MSHEPPVAWCARCASLHDDERLTAEHEALVQLVLSTAADYGEARRYPSTARYVLPKMAQAHQAEVLELSEAVAPLLADSPDRAAGANTGLSPSHEATAGRERAQSDIPSGLVFCRRAAGI